VANAVRTERGDPLTEDKLDGVASVVDPRHLMPEIHHFGAIIGEQVDGRTGR